MDGFFVYFYEDIGQVFRKFIDVFASLFEFLWSLINFPGRMDIIDRNHENFNTLDWILLLLANLLLIAAVVVLCILFAKLLRKIFRQYIPAKKYDELAKQVRSLQRDLIRANYEKDKLLAMRVAELGGQMPGEEPIDDKDSDQENQDGQEDFIPLTNRNSITSPCVNPEDSRFFRLTAVDNFYKSEYVPPIYNETFTLEDFCVRFRDYSASQLGLYYDLDMIRYFIASLGTARIIILQGISGTGKTSLPYAFGQFVNNPTTVVSVQPAWRERTELYGYFNEFSMK
ncbi:MAG: hypothetical protein E7447_02120 [Ruminococcaceae bacterium]|nr:hypothetical protein [Oscillospiraceae bacterium]